MESTRNVLQKRLGAAEYDRLLNTADQINFFGEPVKELSREELLAALTLTLQSNQGQIEQNTKENNLGHFPPNNRTAGLW